MSPRKKAERPRHTPPTSPPASFHLLLVEDNAADAELCRRLLSDAGLNLDVETATTRAAAEQLIRTRAFDIVITDHHLPDGDANDIIRFARVRDAELACIVITGSLDDQAAALLASGAFDYVLKDRPARLAPAVQHALDTRRVRAAAAEAVRTIGEQQRDIAARLVRTLENMSDGFVALDHDWRYTYVNRRAGEMLGAPPDELVGKAAWSDFPDAGHRSLRQACDRALAEQRAVVIEAPFLLSARWLETRVLPAPDGLAVFFHDVTQRREAEDALRASEHRFRSVVESAASGMLIVDGAGKILFVNRSVQQQLGYAPEELVGKPVESLVPRRFQGPHPSYRASFHAAPTARPMGAGRDLFGLHKDGHEVPVEIGLTPLETADGLAVLVTIVDITERKRSEVERDALARRLLELQESERRALANELHDEVGQLLTGLKLMLEGRGTMGGPDEMGQLVREALSRVRDVSMNLRPPMLDELGLLPTLQWLVQRLRSHTGIAVRFAHDGLDRRFAQSLETAAFRIAQEALTNVARHAGVQEADLEVRAAGDRLTILVLDRGAGFERPPGAPPATQGLTGMNERARLLGGKLHVESTPGRGTRVLADFPIQALAAGDAFP